jgi:hypothetical protein
MKLKHYKSIVPIGSGGDFAIFFSHFTLFGCIYLAIYVFFLVKILKGFAFLPKAMFVNGSGRNEPSL